MEITEKKNGKQATKKFTAKNADELKKKHPQAHETYKKYERFVKAVAQRNPPARAAAPAVAPAIQQRANGNRLDVASRLIQSMGRNIENVADDKTIDGASKESREALQKEIAEMKNRLSEIEKKLQKANDAEAQNEKTAKKTPAEPAEVQE